MSARIAVFGAVLLHHGAWLACMWPSSNTAGVPAQAVVGGSEKTVIEALCARGSTRRDDAPVEDVAAQLRETRKPRVFWHDVFENIEAPAPRPPPPPPTPPKKPRRERKPRCPYASGVVLVPGAGWCWGLWKNQDEAPIAQGATTDAYTASLFLADAIASRKLRFADVTTDFNRAHRWFTITAKRKREPPPPPPPPSSSWRWTQAPAVDLSALGVSWPCSRDELKRAYRKKAFETHPDRGGSSAEFIRVRAAYESGLRAMEVSR